ncbi:MAG TPA: hypothetical protein VKS22_12675 [Candidatus Binataceae bacterium]|nr:hypothetical protein [Candidatus Binataceae bacterium]
MDLEELRKALEHPLFDSAIVKHGFAPFFRDYDLIAQIENYQFHYRFTHCTSATVTTAVRDDVWPRSWDDLFTDYPAWEREGCPEGYVWGVCWSLAYPGAEYVENSTAARNWSERLGKPMHEVNILTNGYNINLIFHDLIVRELKEGDKEWVPGILDQYVFPIIR